MVVGGIKCFLRGLVSRASDVVIQALDFAQGDLEPSRCFPQLDGMAEALDYFW